MELLGHIEGSFKGGDKQGSNAWSLIFLSVKELRGPLPKAHQIVKPSDPESVVGKPGKLGIMN